MCIPILYINLDRSQNRNAKMVDELDKIDVDYYRIQGIDSNCINKNAQKFLSNGECQGFKYYIKPNIIFKPREKEIAIILSHLKAIKKLIESDFEIAVIMEDDISFRYIDNWNEKIEEVINFAPKDWKIIKMHTSAHNEIMNNIKLCEKNIFYIPMTTKLLHSAGCYIIRKEAAKEILEKYEKNGIYTFPHKDEYCVCECIIFSIPNIYMYTIPYICAVDDNITCAGNHNPADTKSNKVISEYWEKKGKNKIFDFANQKIEESGKIKIKTIKNMIIQNRKRE
jgi:GR25 family glycosyltransferase involved in LPS biosynthesis